MSAFPGPADAIRVSADGGSQVRWRHDGRELFFVAADRRMMAASVDESADGRSLEVARAAALFRTRLAVGSNIASERPQYDVASDGRFLMNVFVDEPASSPIEVLLNWERQPR